MSSSHSERKGRGSGPAGGTGVGASLRVYRADRDEVAVCAVWRGALGARWPVSREAFRRVLAAGGEAQAGDHLVTVAADGAVVGFVATQVRTEPDAPAPVGAVVRGLKSVCDQAAC